MWLIRCSFLVLNHIGMFPFAFSESMKFSVACLFTLQEKEIVETSKVQPLALWILEYKVTEEVEWWEMCVWQTGESQC